MIVNKWRVKRTDDNCVLVEIDKTVDITGLEFSLINDHRQKILSMKVTSHEISICSDLQRPTYAQLGSTMKYVDGSGREYYSTLT